MESCVLWIKFDGHVLKLDCDTQMYLNSEDEVDIFPNTELPFNKGSNTFILAVTLLTTNITPFNQFIFTKNLLTNFA